MILLVPESSPGSVPVPFPWQQVCSAHRSCRSILANSRPLRHITAYLSDIRPGHPNQLLLSSKEPRCETFESPPLSSKTATAIRNTTCREFGRCHSGAVELGAEVVSFHEGAIPAYSFLRRLPRPRLLKIAERVPDGPSVRALMDILCRVGGPDPGRFTRGRRRDALQHVRMRFTAGNWSPGFASCTPSSTVTSLQATSTWSSICLGCKCGILICYDNNLPENVRVTALMGAEIIFMPHVTCCLPSVMPGRGEVDPKLWENRERDPVSLRLEFMGPKGRGWLLRWLPTRAYENGVYAVFTNPVGVDDDQIRNGNAMILDPFGEIIAESNALGDDVVVGLCTIDKLKAASGQRYLRARRPELYGKLLEPPTEPPVTAPGWDVGSPNDR